jgi:hypothetical protein
MSGRTAVVQHTVLTRIYLYMMGAAGTGVTGIDPSDAGFSCSYQRDNVDAPVLITGLAVVAPSAANAVNQWREHGRGWYSVVGPLALYASGVPTVQVSCTCTTPAALSDDVMVFFSADNIFAAALTGPAVSAEIMADLADADGAAARAAIAAAVDAIVANDFGAVLAAIAGIATGTPPSAATVSAQVMSDLADGDGAAARAALSVAIRDAFLRLRAGVQSVPSGGSAQPLALVDAGTNAALGTTTVVRDATGKILGHTEAVV